MSGVMKKLYELVPQGQTQTIDAAITVVVGLLLVCLLLKVLEDFYSRGNDTFYPTQTHLRVLMYKLATGMITKGSGWKRKVRSKDFALCDRVLSARLPLEPRAEHVADLIKVCELKDDAQHMPLAYPAMLMIYPNCLLFANAEYPFPAVGSVHVSNHTKIFRPMPVNEAFTGLIKVDPVVRPAKKGTEVTFLSTLLDASGEPVWSNASTYLILHKQPKEVRDAIKKDPPSSEPESEPVLEGSWKLGGSMGVRYAAVSKDNNPIHTMPLMAKAFGFPNVIMHGMYFIIRAASECQALLGDNMSYPVEVSAKFVRPVVLPGEVSLSVYSGPKGAMNDLRYIVRSKKSGKVAVEGTFTCTMQSQ